MNTSNKERQSIDWMVDIMKNLGARYNGVRCEGWSIRKKGETATDLLTDYLPAGYDNETESVILINDTLNYRGLPSVDIRPVREWDFFDENGELVDFKWNTEI